MINDSYCKQSNPGATIYSTMKSLFNTSLLYSITLPVLLSLILLSACSQVKETTEPQEASESAEKGPYQPEWYSDSNFQSDSLRYSATATAISYDSASAARAVKTQSFEFLKKGVAEKMEEKRTELQEKEGNAFAGYKEFIVMLRQAESTIPDYAKLTKIEVIAEPKDNGTYRGFAQVTMNRKQLLNWLNESFASNQSYLSAFKKHFE